MAYIDGDFSTPRQILGSGVRQISDFNHTDFILNREYVQSKATFAPIALSVSGTPVVDSIYSTAHLVDQTETKRDGYLVWYKRTYATIPATRTEKRNVSFSFPGASAIVSLGGSVYTWNQYGGGQPSTQFREAIVELSYSLGAPTVSLPTQITYMGAAVDFAGNVYQVLADGTLGALLGVTSPATIPSTFIMSDVARRWHGNIWEREKITVNH